MDAQFLDGEVAVAAQLRRAWSGAVSAALPERRTTMIQNCKYDIFDPEKIKGQPKEF